MKKLLSTIQTYPEWFILIGLSLVLRLINLSTESLWFDESFTALVAKQGANFWPAVFGDDHPPLWSVIQWFNVHLLGQSEIVFRLPATLMSIGCVLLIWRIALALKFERKTAFLAGLLTAIVPASIYFGQDGRMYAALAFFLLLVIWAALTDHWFLFFIGATGAVYTQNAGLMYVFAIGSIVLLTRIKTPRRLIKPVLALSGTVLMWLPWSIEFVIMAQRVKESFWMPPINGLNVWWPYLFDTVGARIPDLLQPHVYGVAICISIVGLIVSRQWLKSEQGAIILSGLFGGPLCLASFSLIWQRNIFVYRPILVSGLLLMIFWAYALMHLSIPNRKVARIVVGATLLVAILFHYTYNLREDIPAWLQPVTSQWQPGDVIYYTNGTPAILFQHYLADKPSLIRPYHGDVMSITDEDRTAFGMVSEPFDLLPIQGYKRVWLLTIRNPFTEPDEATELDRILANYKVETIKNFQTSKISWDAIYLIQLPQRLVP